MKRISDPTIRRRIAFLGKALPNALIAENPDMLRKIAGQSMVERGRKRARAALNPERKAQMSRPRVEDQVVFRKFM
jgi:hypothetical protein